MTDDNPTAKTDAAETDTVLRLRDLVVTFSTETGDVPAVRGASLQVRPGETLALVGESGSGKSTVALAAIGLLSPNATMAGQAEIDGTDIVSASESTLRRMRGSTVGMVFQEPATALDPLTRIGAQITEVIRNHRSMTAADAHAEAVQLLRRVGLPDPETRISAFPFQLSGGQRQRVVIAMAIANHPRLLIADEPTTALDVTVQADILELLRGLAADNRMAVLLVTHNMGVVADFADRVAVMNQGEIVETGSVEDVLLHPRHDYSKRLLAAVPRLEVEDRALATDDTLDADDTVAISLTDVTVDFGRGRKTVRALDSVSIQVRHGETIGVVGESGSGKSTAARVALGLIKPLHGEVALFGQPMKGTRGRGRRELQSRIGVVLQDPVASLDARMSVAEVVAEPLRIHRKDLSSRERRRMVTNALEAVRLSASLADRAPRELSGGQRQRVSLARALVLDPQLLIADEPTSALDVSVQEAVLEVIGEMQSVLGFACMFVSHDLAVVQSFCSRVVVMRSGTIVEEGPTAATLVRPSTDYTKRLLAAVPVPDPVVQRRRRAERLALANDTSLAVG